MGISSINPLYMAQLIPIMRWLTKSINANSLFKIWRNWRISIKIGLRNNFLAGTPSESMSPINPNTNANQALSCHAMIVRTTFLTLTKPSENLYWKNTATFSNTPTANRKRKQNKTSKKESKYRIVMKILDNLKVESKTIQFGRNNKAIQKK